jgi:hypothetical protein
VRRKSAHALGYSRIDEDRTARKRLCPAPVDNAHDDQGNVTVRPDYRDSTGGAHATAFETCFVGSGFVRDRVVVVIRHVRVGGMVAAVSVALLVPGSVRCRVARLCG